MKLVRRPFYYLDALILVALASLVVAMSLAQGAYNLDPHHWGLMVSNAVDLIRGRAPYKEIFIQYGFLTVAIEAAFYSIFHNIMSLLLGVALLYAAGLAGIYFLTLEMTSNRRIALYAFIISFLVHPLTIYPWPNYVAFPFIVYGFVALMKGRDNAWAGLLGGVLFGCAVLAREGLMLPLSIVVIASAPIYLWCSPTSWRLAPRVTPVVGFVLPLAAFGLYLFQAGLLEYWRLTAIELPKLYVPIFFPHGMAAAIIALLIYLFDGHARQTVFILIILSAAVVGVHALFRRQRADPGHVIVALGSGLLLSSALHLNEIFRLAASVLLGTGLIFLLADKLRLAGPLFIVLACSLVISAFDEKNGNYFLPSRTQIEAATTSDRIRLFVGQRWPKDAFEYYDWFAEDMARLSARSCGLHFFRNETRDAFLAALAPFRQYQLMPVGAGLHDVPLEEWNQRLRPDYVLSDRLQARDVVVFASRNPEDVASFVPPEGYRIFDSRVAPRSRFLPNGEVTLILTPEACGERN